MTNGKGSQRRPSTISDAEFEDNWNLAFGNNNEDDTTRTESTGNAGYPAGNPADRSTSGKG